MENTLSTDPGAAYERAFAAREESLANAAEYEAKGWRFIWLTDDRLLLPAKENHCWTKAPAIHFSAR